MMQIGTFVAVHPIWMEIFCRVAAEHVQSEDEQHRTTDNLHPKNVPLVSHEVHDERHAQCGDQSV